LRRKIDVLLTQIDGGQSGASISPINGARLVHEWDQNVESAAGDLVEAAEPLDQHYGGLGHDPDRFYGDHQQHDSNEAEEEEGKNAGNGIHD
jgi:hypothetical protein